MMTVFDQRAMDVKEILVPMDFSEISLAALTCAKVIAEKCSAELHVLHVDDDPILIAPTTSEEYREQQEEARLQKMRELFDTQEHERFKPVLAVRRGSAAQAILEYAEQFKIDLIVMGMLGHSALTNMLLGSVAEHVMKKAACPVVSVRKPVS